MLVRPFDGRFRKVVHGPGPERAGHGICQDADTLLVVDHDADRKRLDGGFEQASPVAGHRLTLRSTLLPERLGGAQTGLGRRRPRRPAGAGAGGDAPDRARRRCRPRIRTSRARRAIVVKSGSAPLTLLMVAPRQRSTTAPTKAAPEIVSPAPGTRPLMSLRGCRSGGQRMERHPRRHRHALAERDDLAGAQGRHEGQQVRGIRDRRGQEGLVAVVGHPHGEQGAALGHDGRVEFGRAAASPGRGGRRACGLRGRSATGRGASA